MAFTRTPDNPAYVVKGQNASLVWEYSVDDRQKELKAIVWSVADKVTGAPVFLVIETKSRNRSYAPGIPETYKGRTSIEKSATLVIQNVTLDDSASFTCSLLAEGGSGAVGIDESTRLIVTGMFASVNSVFCNNMGFLGFVLLVIREVIRQNL